jgi:hypothetical protein
MENLKLLFWENPKDPAKPFKASVKNTFTGNSFFLASYGTKSKREKLAPKLMQKKIDNPSAEFQRFNKIPQSQIKTSPEVKSELKVLAVSENRIQVRTSSGDVTVFARYDDEKGVYFYNEDLKKEYVGEITPEEKAPEPESLFRVEYNRPDGTKDIIHLKGTSLNSATKAAKKLFNKNLIQVEIA